MGPPFCNSQLLFDSSSPLLPPITHHRKVSKKYFKCLNKYVAPPWVDAHTHTHTQRGTRTSVRFHIKSVQGMWWMKRALGVVVVVAPFGPYTWCKSQFLPQHGWPLPYARTHVLNAWSRRARIKSTNLTHIGSITSQGRRSRWEGAKRDETSGLKG